MPLGAFLLLASMTACTALVDSSRTFGGPTQHERDAGARDAAPTSPPDVRPTAAPPAYVQIAYLKSDTPERLGAFGYPVALSGETAFVGSAGASIGLLAHAGRAYEFAPTGSTWSASQILQSPSPAANGGVPNVLLPTLGAHPPGISVAISGATLVLGVAAEDGVGKDGERLPNAGSVYVFRNDTGEWKVSQRLTASDPRTLDAFGLVVALEGDTLAVAAPWNDGPRDPGTDAGAGGDAGARAVDSGAVYVFERGASGFAETQILRAEVLGEGDLFGASLALDQNLLAVGVPTEPGSGSGPSADPHQRGRLYAGAVYTFTRTDARSAWAHDRYVKPAASGQSEFFGMSVAIAGGTLIVGAPTLARKGSVHSFDRVGGEWTESGPPLLPPSQAGGAQLFGTALATASDVLVVGAPGDASPARRVDGDAAALDPAADQSGAAHVYFKRGASWEHAAYLKASNAARGDLFGLSVAATSTLVSVGAPSQNGLSRTLGGDLLGDSGTVWAGAAYLFRRNTL